MLGKAKTGNISIKGDGNISNTGITGGDVIINADQEIGKLKQRIMELEEENKQLKTDKAILQEFVTFLQNKKQRRETRISDNHLVL